MLNTHLEITVNDTPVKGRICSYDPSEIAVKILSPYKGLTNASAHIMLMALGTRSYKGEFGLTTANKLLEELFNFCDYVDDNYQSLHFEFLNFLKKKEEVDNYVQSLSKKKAPLKLEFKEGQLTENEYRDKLKELRQYIEGEKRKLESIWKDFLTENFKVEIPLGRIEEYLRNVNLHREK